jgi:hypothetical protein
MTARIRRNTAEALAAYQVAGLTFLEDAVVFTARVLAITYPAIHAPHGQAITPNSRPHASSSTPVGTS